MTLLNFARALLLALCLVSANSFADTTRTLKPLYPPSAFMPNRFLPFRLILPPENDERVSSLAIDGASPEICRVGIDPFRGDVLLLYCRQPVSQLSILVGTKSVQGSFLTTFSNISVQNDGVKTGSPSPTPAPTSTPASATPTPTPAPINGQQLASQTCLLCHSLADLKGKNLTLTVVKSAIRSQPAMASLSSLSDAQINAIVTYVQGAH